MSTVSESIFGMVKDYIVVPTTSCTNTFPDAPIVPVAGFSEVLGIDVPDAEAYVTHPLSTDGTIAESPTAPGYNYAYADIATVALTDIATAVYSDYTLPDTLPEDVAGTPDMAYPEASYAEVNGDAGLSTLTPPTLTVGATPAFLDIPSFSYDLTDIAMLDGTLPDPPVLPDVDMVSDPDKLVLTITPELLEAIDAGLDGETLLSHEVQQIMVDRAKRLIDDKFDHEERAVFAEFAARGFFATTGPLVSTLSELTQDASYADREPHEAMRGEVYERGLKQLTTAIKSALALETANVAVHLDYCQKLVEVLKFNVAMQVEFANLLVTMFNQQLQGIRVIVGAYEQYVSTTVEEYQAKVNTLDAATAVLDTNAAKNTVYEAQAGTVDAQAKVLTLEVEDNTHEIKEFTQYVSGILRNVEIARTNIEAFSQATRAYSMAIDSDSARISGYASQVRATGSATGVYEANWEAYAAAQNAGAAVNDARRSWYNSSLQSLSKEVQTLQSAATAQRSYLSTLTDWAQTNSNLYSQYASAVGAVSTYTKSYNRHSVALQEAASNIELAREDAEVRMAALEAQAVAVQESINIGLEAAEATAAAGCAQAAYSMRSISAGMRASAGMTDSSRDASGLSKNLNLDRQYSHSKTSSVTTSG